MCVCIQEGRFESGSAHGGASSTRAIHIDSYIGGGGAVTAPPPPPTTLERGKVTERSTNPGSIAARAWQARAVVGERWKGRRQTEGKRERVGGAVAAAAPLLLHIHTPKGWLLLLHFLGCDAISASGLFAIVCAVWRFENLILKREKTLMFRCI